MYGETIIIIAWNIMIMLMIYHYDKSISVVEKILFTISFSAYSAWLVADQGVPEYVWPIVQSSNMAFNMMARLPQIYANFASKSTGVLSMVTIFLAWAGSATRLSTVLIESDDFLYALQFISGLVLNTILLLQFCIYPSGAAKVADDDKKKQ